MYSKSTIAKRAACRRAFTLLELMVVLMIMGLMAGIVVFKTRSYVVLSKQNTAKVEIAKICEALETFYAANDRYPTNEEGILLLASKSDKFPDGILNKLPRDPWGNPYQYNNPGRHGAYDVISYGADGREGGEAADKDITSYDDDKERTK